MPIFDGFVKKNMKNQGKSIKIPWNVFFPLATDYPAKSGPKIVAQPGIGLQKAGV